MCVRICVGTTLKSPGCNLMCEILNYMWRDIAIKIYNIDQALRSLFGFDLRILLFSEYFWSNISSPTTAPFNIYNNDKYRFC